MADEDVQAELARLRAENEALKQKRNTAVSMKVSEKGGVSVYGLGRFPVTLYLNYAQNGHPERWSRSADAVRG